MNLLLSDQTGICADFIEQLGIAAGVVAVDGDSFSLVAINQLCLGFYGIESLPIGIDFKLDNFKAHITNQSEFTAYFERLMANYRHVCDTQKQVVTETDFTAQDGAVRWSRNTLTPLMLDERVFRILITVADITEIKIEQEALEFALATLASRVVSICDGCENVCDEEQQWVTVTQYLSQQHLNQNHLSPLSHTICPKCAEHLLE